jgi:pimeloyl-ACP methyl ester carboxylesterase
MSGKEAFEVTVDGGALRGWIAGTGPNVLMLHGGPGLEYSYLDDLVTELESEFHVAAYQQRGLEPSTVEGPFTIAQAIDDVVAVLDGLGWSRSLVVGHSWGGHLALRLVAALPERLLGALAVDPLGVVGDGGMAAFAAEMSARASKDSRDRARELDERAMDGQGTPEDAIEGLRLVWPSYFGDPENVAPMPSLAISLEAYAGIISEIGEGTDRVTAALASTEVPYGVVAGAASPMPWGQAARASAELSPTAFLEVVPGAGHFPWFEAPGSVRSALKRLS